MSQPPDFESLLVVGDGPVARAFTRSLAERGGAPLGWSRRHKGPLPAADVVLLAVRDEAVPILAAQVMASPGGAAPILLHCAGARAAEEMLLGPWRRPRGIGLIHPLVSIAAEIAQPLPPGTVFGIQGDAAGREAALRLAARLDGVPLVLEASALPVYHAACALAANHSVGLIDGAVGLLATVGVDRARATAAMAGLLTSTAANLARLGLPEALTGPIARGDYETVDRHLRALAGSRDLELYRATALRIVGIATQKGVAPPEALARIRALLEIG